MARIRKRVQSMRDDTRPPLPPNMQYLFKGTRDAVVWALIGVCLCLLTWLLLLCLWWAVT